MTTDQPIPVGAPVRQKHPDNVPFVGARVGTVVRYLVSGRVRVEYTDRLHVGRSTLVTFAVEELERAE